MKSFMKNSKVGRGGNQGGVRANIRSVDQDNPGVTQPIPPPSNEQVQVNSNADVVVEDDVAPQNLNGVEQGKIELSPDGLWFDDHTVSGNVSKAWKAHYNHSYMNWTEVPLMVRDRWFTEFKAKKKDGILPTAAEVYKSTHSVCMGNDEVELMGDKTHQVMGEYMEKLEEYKNKGIEINPDKVYLEVVGGQKKGKVYGLGLLLNLLHHLPLLP